MERALGLVADPVTGGTTYDDIADGTFETPTTWIPVTGGTGNVEPQLQQTDRNNMVMGINGTLAPRPFAARPQLTFDSLAYPQLLRFLAPKALGGTITPSGTAPAAITSKIEPLKGGNLPALQAWLMRDDQIDFLTGLVISSLGLNFPIDGDGTVSVEARALYHTVGRYDDAEHPDGTEVEMPTVTYSYGDGITFQLMRATLYEGDGPGEEVDGFAGFGLTFTNALSDDMRATHRPNKNIATYAVDGELRDTWFPGRHRRTRRQAPTGRIDFASTDPDRELLRLVGAATKLVFEVTAHPLGTTPEADEAMRITMYKAATTGGGADALVADGDQYASYEFGAFLNPATGKDVEIEFVGTAAITG